MLITGKILDYDGQKIVIKPNEDINRILLQKNISSVEIRLVDGRQLTAIQRNKIFAILKDISLWSGHDPEYLRMYLTWDYRCYYGLPDFSLEDTDMTTAKGMITYLIEFCLKHNIPTKKPLIKQCEDIGKLMYSCLEHKKCAICNNPGEVHHVDRIGMGRDREQIVHEGLNAICLCREHHDLAHKGEKRLFNKFHIFGIKLDGYLCKILKLKGVEHG